MESLTDKEFNELFDRVTRRVDLTGCRTPEDVNRRLKQKIQEQSYLPGPKVLALLHVTNRNSFFRNLIPGFGRRTIDAAVSRPKGIAALTLKHGRKKAKDILLNRARRRLVSNRSSRRKRR